MFHLGKHNQVKSQNVHDPLYAGCVGVLFCDTNSLMRHIIIQIIQDRQGEFIEEIKDLKNSESEDRAITMLGRAHENLKHYFFCEEYTYILTLTMEFTMFSLSSV
ncbi:unnamed protein product [Menidia menidia]|uniref:(Atlantic silverside) hypothetical protein n=1 Tax=Menidia menidia TaxID=238744 RepID=A0A8S4ABU9_9TELE|nr:unnamed protein product [Menidia menidia]